MGEYEFAGRELESPLISMAGVFNDRPEQAIIDETEQLARTAIGGITQGSTTPLERVGNEVRFGGQTDHYDPETRIMTNSKGLGQIGLVRMQAIVPDLVAIGEENNTAMIFSVSPELPEDPNVDIGGPTEQTLRLVEGILTVGGKLVEINVSCPNVIAEDGSRKPMVGYDPAAVEELTEALVANFGDRLGIGIKVPPYMTEQGAEFSEIADTVITSGMYEFVTTANTINGHQPKDPETGEFVFKHLPGMAGGRSGPGEWAEGRFQLELWQEAQEAAGKSLDVVSGLGVGSGHEVAKRRELGATVVGANTIFYRATDKGAVVEQVLSEYAAEAA